MYDLTKYFQIFFKNVLLTLFYLERHVMESKNYFWELFFILLPTRVSRRFLLNGLSFAEKRVWFSQELPNFLQIYVAYTILSRKTCDGEQKLFLRINLHINAHEGIGTIFCWLERLLLKNVYDLAKNFQIFFKNMLLTSFYRWKTCDGEQKLFLRNNLHINAHKGIEKIFADWTVFCWKTCMI